MNVLAIGYGRKLFDSRDQEFLRLEQCAVEAGRIDMVVFSNKKDGLETKVMGSHLTLHPTNSSFKIFMPLDAFRVSKRIIRKEKSTIITTQDPFETALVGYLIKIIFKLKLVIQEHGDFFTEPYWSEESFLNKLRFRFGVFVLKRADLVRVVSDRVFKTMLGLGVQEHKLRKLAVAIDISDFIYSENKNLDFFNVDSFIFLTVGRLVPQKNLSLLLEAFLNVYIANPKVRLLIIGSGPQAETLSLVAENINKKYAIKSGPAVKILPWSDEIPSLMSSVDAYVLSSNYEGWGRVLIEAMCSNLPIVTTDVGCVNEVVKNEEHGLIVPIGNSNELTKAMLEISTNRAKYQLLKNNLQVLDKRNIPGTNLSGYGREWLISLN